MKNDAPLTHEEFLAKLLPTAEMKKLYTEEEWEAGKKAAAEWSERLMKAITDGEIDPLTMKPVKKSS